MCQSFKFAIYSNFEIKMHNFSSGDCLIFIYPFHYDYKLFEFEKKILILMIGHCLSKINQPSQTFMFQVHLVYRSSIFYVL